MASGKSIVRAALRVGIAVVAWMIVLPGTTGPSPIGAARQAAAAPLGRPNIIVVLTDDQSITSLRYPLMPYFESQLKDPSQRWARFVNAFDNNPLCCPSRATILTGQYSHHNGVWCVERGPHCGEALAERHTIATWLHAAGYRTGLFGKYLNYYPFGRGNYTPPGWDQWHAFTGAGGGTYYDYDMVENGRRVHYGSAPQDHSTIVLGNEAARFVSTARRPFFAYIATSSPHYHWTAEPAHVGTYDHQAIRQPPSFDERNVSDKPAWVRRLPMLKPGVEAQDQRDELSSLLDVDGLLKQVFTAVKDRGQWNNTVVIYLSDNGYSYGAHRWQDKRCPYEECIRVPMFIRDPRGGVSHTVGHLVSNVDIASTIARLARARPDIRQDGHGLVPLVKGQPVRWREDNGLLLEYRRDGQVPSWWGVHTHRYMYDELQTGERELYDLSRDPYELHNVVRSPKYRAAVARLHCRMMHLRGLPC